jgi:hypothetical protein
MVDLYILVKQKISEVSQKVYPERASSEAQFPYVVFNFPTTSDAIVRDDIILEVDIWDSKRSGYDVLSAIEQLTTQVDNTLKNLKELDNDTFYKFERVTRLNLKDPDTNIFRRQLRYLVKKY